MSMTHDEMNVYLDFYEILLTPKQQEIMNSYYREDYSLAEIAENKDVSRSAISDAIRKATQAIMNYDEKLNLVKKYQVRISLYHELEGIEVDAVQKICRLLKESEIENYE